MAPVSDRDSREQLPAVGSVIMGKYRVEGELGRGGMGVVYRARNLVTGKVVAVKWLLPQLRARADARERFLREARAAARIAHPNVVDVFDVLEDGGAMFLVMEHLVGEPLSERLKRAPMSFQAVVELLLPAMRAVAMAHARGVIHRDIKPENLFICALDDGREQIKVLDFGISKIVDGAGEASLTQSGTAVGTPHYMSLEQLNGQRDLDGRVDVYAFAVILYQACTGRLPFEGDLYGAIAIQVATGTPDIPRKYCPDIPPLLERAVLGGLARHRHARFPSMQAFIAALETAFDPERAALDATLSAVRPHVPALPRPMPVEVPRSPAVVRARRPVRVLAAVACVLCSLSVVAAWWWSTQLNSAPARAPRAIRVAPRAAPMVDAKPPGNDRPGGVAAQVAPAPVPTPSSAAPAPQKPRVSHPKIAARSPNAAPVAPAQQAPLAPAPVVDTVAPTRPVKQPRSGPLDPGQF